MTKSLSLNRTDTTVSGVPSLSLPMSVLNFAADFRVKDSDSKKETIITNMTSPIDRPETIRIGVSEIKNVYTGTGIDPSVMSPSKKGVSIVCQIKGTWTVTDSVDASYRVDLPVEAHIVMKIPAHELITADVTKAWVGRMAAGLVENTGLADSTRLNSLLRGSLLPSDMR